MGNDISRLNHFIYSFIPVIWLIIAFNNLNESILFIPKNIFVGIVFIFSLLATILIANSKSDSKYRKRKQLYLSIFEMISIFWVIFLCGSFNNIQIEKAVSFAVGVIIYFVSFTFIGLKRNQFLGVKTPGALDSDKIWDLTHKVSAVTWPIGSLFLFGQLFWDSQKFSVPIMLIAGVFILVIPFSVSYDVE